MKSELELQKEFVENPELKEQIDFLKSDGIKGLQGVVHVEAFLRGIRDLGYKDVPYAFNELNDNSFQAGARNIHYELVGVSNKTREIVVYDDGHGMPKEMLAVAVTWGGTHRQGSRKGFGKYGYGLPSACLSLAKKYTVYSKIKGGPWNKITFDITPLDNEQSVDLNSIMSQPEECTLPGFINDFEGENYSASSAEQGTIIHVEELDRVKPIQLNTLQNALMFDFGQTYFKLLQSTNMYINNKKVSAVDICFATPGLKGFKDPMNNISVPINDDNYYFEKEVTIVSDVDESEHDITIRFSRLPALFAIKNDSDIEDTKEAWIKNTISRNADMKSFRSKVMSENHGIVFRRLGRRMDVAGSRQLKNKMRIQTNSRYWMCEVNFPPVLDEHFQVNTSKQQIIPSEKFLQTLEDNDVFKILNKFERDYADEREMLKSQMVVSENEDESQKKESEILAEEAALTLGNQTATPDHQERVDKANERKQARIEEIAKKEKITVEQAATNYEEIYKDRPKVFTEEKIGKNMPFIKLDEHGDTSEVIINTEHRFYKNFYMGKGSNEDTRKTWQTFWLMYAELFHKYSEDHKDFLETFLNTLGENLKVIARKDYEKKEADGSLDTDDQYDPFSDLDEEIILDQEDKKEP